MLFDRGHPLSVQPRANHCLQEMRSAQRSGNPNLHNEKEGLRRGLAELEGCVGGSGARGGVRWEQGKADFLQPPLSAGRIQLGVRRAKEGRQAVAVCTQALLLVKVVFPHDLAVRGHPAHVHLQRTLHLRHCSISAGRPGCHADDDVEERSAALEVV